MFRSVPASRLPAVAALGLFFAIPAGLAAAEGMEVLSVNYQCDDGTRMPVLYINTAGGDSLAVAVIQGNLVPMQLQPSASGARYGRMNPRLSFELWVKGDQVTVSDTGKADAPAELLTTCTEEK